MGKTVIKRWRRSIRGGKGGRGLQVEDEMEQGEVKQVVKEVVRTHWFVQQPTPRH